MKLIANKNIFQSTETYFSYIKNNLNLIDGASLEVVLTKDKIPLVITTYPSTDITSQVIKAIQNTNLEDITDYDILTLNDALQKLNNLPILVLINFIPLPTTPYAQNIEIINKVNREQVEIIYNIIDKYPNLNIYLASLNHNIIFHIKERNKKNKTGVILTPYETNYIDVDFYIFSPEMLSLPILSQQISFNKEIMISSRSSEDMMNINNFFNKINNIDKQKILNYVFFISDYPLIINKLLS